MNGPEPSFVRVPTPDGATLTLKRKIRAGGPPALFVHGLAANADLWDLPAVKTAEYEFRSLATVLHENGYDVWLLNLRGHGAPAMLSAPPPGQNDWCVDHFVLYDLPAAIEFVRQATRRRPFVIGNSMGAMTLAGHLQGAALLEDGAGPRIVADAGAARRRQEQLAGAVFVEFPAALRWPQALYDEKGQLRWERLLREWFQDRADANYAFEVLARWGWLQALVNVAGTVPLDWLRPRDAFAALRAQLPRPIADGLARVEQAFVQTMLGLASKIHGPTQHQAEAFLGRIRHAADHIKAGVLRQMGKSVRQGSFVSALGAPDHVYADHYARIELPTLLVLGGRDRIANAATTRAVFFEKIAAPDKTLKFYADIAHGEFEAAPVAFEKVYPDVHAWLAARDKWADAL